MEEDGHLEAEGKGGKKKRRIGQRRQKMTKKNKETENK